MKIILLFVTRYETSPSCIFLLISIHRHALRVAAHLPGFLRRTDWAARMIDGAALLECEKLLSAEALVVDLRSSFDEILKVSTRQEVAEVDEFAMVLILDIDNTPAVLATTNLLSSNDNGLLGADDGEWNEILDLSIECNFLVVVLFIIIWIHAKVVESKLFSYPLLESSALLESQTITLGNNGNDVDEFRELLENDNVDWLQAMARRLNEEQAAMNTSVLEVALTLSAQLLAQICAMLVLDILDNWVPASLIVDEIAVSRSINDVES